MFNPVHVTPRSVVECMLFHSYLSLEMIHKFAFVSDHRHQSSH
jgi:hypothetical protein